METLVAFLASQPGKIVSGALLVVGLTDVFIAKLVFGKQINKVEEQLMTIAAPEARQPLEARIKGLQYVSRAVITTGIIFLLFGIFGLTR